MKNTCATENFVNTVCAKTMKMDLIKMVYVHSVKESAFVLVVQGIK